MCSLLVHACLSIAAFSNDSFFYDDDHHRRPEAGSFLAKGEPWWVILAMGKGGDSLIGLSRMLVDNLGNDVAECKVQIV